MPPSPSPRRSRKEISHERGHSFESILPAKPKDDELTLFTDMQKHERDNFLLDPVEDFDESISKLSYFPDLKLGVNIAGRGENRDLLNADGEGNDYDWLLTPPETPLFRSLDDEEDQHIGMAHRGRAQIKPISLSRSSTMDSTRRSNRSSASPSRLSPSPRSCSSTVFTMTRSSNSSSRCSTPLALQPATPSWKSSTPASKTLTPPRRSPSPASRRMSTGSSDPISNGRRGNSPVKASHRTYSLNLHGVQSSDPGFSFEAPPNLRTSLPDRPVSSSRGGSPSSFSGLDMNQRGRRQSISSTPSRRASSYNSNDQYRFGSCSKASARSYAEDDLESMKSIPISYSRSSSPAVRKNLPVMKSTTIASPKKPSKSFYPSSAPKRSFDSAVWLMDQRKAPQDKFRPLLSSVPSTTFGAVKGDDVHSSMLSHDSSLMMSSNLSSEHGVTFGPCMVNDQEQNNVVSQCEATSSSVIHEDIFIFDKLDVPSGGPNCHQCSLSTTQSGPKSPRTVKYAECTIEGLDMEKSRIAQSSRNVASSSEAGHTKMVTCTRCGKLFNEIGDDGEVDFCDECELVDEMLFVDPKIQTLEEAPQPDYKIGNSKPCVALEAPHITPDCIEDIKKSSLDSQLLNDEPQGGCLQKCPESKSTMDTTDRMLSWQHGENVSQNLKPHDIGDSPLGNKIDISSHQCSVSDCQQKEPICVIECDILRDQTANHNSEVCKYLAKSLPESIEFVSDKRTTHKAGSEHLNLKAENTRGAGISVLLLQESSINKWPVVEGRPLAATNNLCSEPYYTRDGVSTPKLTIGCDSSSAASSINQGSSRQSVHFERHKSSNRYDFEKSQISSTISCQSIASMSDMSTSNCSVSVCPRRNAIVDIGFLTNNSESSASITMTCTEELDESCKCTPSSAIECWSAAKAIVNDDIDSFGDAIQNQRMDGMARRDNLSANTCSPDTETHSNIPLSLSPEESCIQKTEERTSAVSQCYSVRTPEHPGDECDIDSYQMQYEAVPASNEANILDDGCVSVISEEDVLFSATEANTIELPDNEELLPTVEGSKEQIQRCFTLEEITDTILFCSSIAHDIAFRAATIGLEREQQSELASAPRPTVATMVGQSIPRVDSSLKPTRRRMPRHRKLSESGTVTETAKMEVVAKDPIPVQQVPEFSRTSDSMKPPKIESKCNCSIM